MVQTERQTDRSVYTDRTTDSPNSRLLLCFFSSGMAGGAADLRYDSVACCAKRSKSAGRLSRMEPLTTAARATGGKMTVWVDAFRGGSSDRSEKERERF